MSSKRAAENNSSCANTSTDAKTSKYFQSPLKQEVDSGDDFNMDTSAPPVVDASPKKLEKEEEEDDSEDEDDWEEVEGK